MELFYHKVALSRVDLLVEIHLDTDLSVQCQPSFDIKGKAGLANVAVELKVWQDMIHAFHLFAPILEEGQQAIAEAGRFLSSCLAN